MRVYFSVFNRGFLFLAFHLSASPLFAHEGKKHPVAGQSDAAAPRTEAQKPSRNLEEIRALYAEGVKLIFRKKCFDCHATAARLPWYAWISGPKQLIEWDMREAKEHLDMRHDFPFGGHGTPSEDLDALEEILTDGSMPPLRYRIMHSGMKLTSRESAVIGAWIKSSRSILGAER